MDYCLITHHSSLTWKTHNKGMPRPQKRTYVRPISEKPKSMKMKPEKRSIYIHVKPISENRKKKVRK
jgi:hypothetical protein